MPFPGTPSPFRLPRQHSTRRSAGPQFANPPRFLLSQTTPQRNDDLDIDDDDGPPSTAPAIARTPAPSRNVPSRWQRDVIEDSGDGKPTRDTGTRGAEGKNLVDYVIDSSPPEQAASPGGLDTDFDVVFAPVGDSHKRRRLSGGAHRSLGEKLNRDNLVPLSSQPQQSGPDHLMTPAPRVASRPTGLDSGIPATPGIPPRPTGCMMPTPGNIKTPFHNKPRFMLSTKKPPSSQTPFRLETPSTQPASAPEGRKPAFILPRAPSPDPADDVPAPFSPSSSTLRRRGRARAGGLDYTPGGMAAEVRSWILEMGSKRENVPTKYSEKTKSLDEYLVTARVVHASQGTLSSSGSVALIQAEITWPSQEEEEEEEEEEEKGEEEKHRGLNIMAMGVPRYRPSSRQALHTGEPQTFSVQVGDLVGIHRGLSWDIELHDFEALTARQGLSLSIDMSDTRQRWLVTMEWDILSEDA